MKFSCDQCQAQYMIADEKVGPKGVKVRCKKCGHIISVTKDEAQASQTSAPAETGGGAPAGSAFDDIFGQSGGEGAGGDERAPTRVFTTSELDRVRQEQALAKGGETRAPSHDEPPTQQMPMAAAQKPEWYLAIHDEQVGPITLDEVQSRWDKGEVHANTLGWRAGLQDWAPVSSIAELAHLLSRPQSGAGSKIAAVAAEVQKPVEQEKPKETVTWRPSGASALADLAKEAAIEAPKPAAAPEAPSPLPDFNPAPVAADPFGGFGAQQGPSTVWQFPSTTAKKSSGSSKALIAVAAAFLVMIATGGVLYALGIIPPKPQYQALPGAGAVPPGYPVQPGQPGYAPPQGYPPQAQYYPPPQGMVPGQPGQPASQPTAAPAPSPAPATPAVASAKEPKAGKKGKAKASGGGEESGGGAEAPEEKPEPKKAAKSGGSDPMDDILNGGGGSKKEVKATLGRDDVLGVVKSNIPAVQKCAAAYSNAGGKLPPKLILKWVIKPSGYTEGHELANPELKGTSVDSCVTAALKKWRFPEYREGNIPVTFPVPVAQ